MIFTQNEKPVLMYHNRTYYEFPNEPVPADKIVDMNGAGDSFVGGFLAAYALSHSPPLTRTASCTVVTCAPVWMPATGSLPA